MTYKSIAVAVDRTSASTHRTRLAARIAADHGARLIGVAAQPVFVVADGVVDATAAIYFSQMEAAKQEIEYLRTAFLDTVAGANNVEWRGTLGVPDLFLSEQARAADLIVIGRVPASGEGDAEFGINAGAIAVSAGRPILVAPPEVERLPLNRVVIAWKDTRECRRALKDAMPLLHRAEAVIVCHMGAAEHDGRSLEDVAKYLQMHAIDARVRHDTPDHVSTEEAVALFHSWYEADLIVAGAYGHTRLREFVFGGVTRTLLHEAPCCCLMSH